MMGQLLSCSIAGNYSNSSLFTSQKKSGGKPTFLTSRPLDLRDRFQVESFSSADHILKSNQLGVRKAGMPPLFCGPNIFAKSG
jgi:hypothetical protein